MKMKVPRRTWWVRGLFAVLLLCVGFLIGWLARTAEKKPVSVTPIRNPISGYHFINPILYTSMPEDLSYPTYMPLENALTAYASSTEKSGKASAIAIYFQDMNTSKWVGVNETEEFDPASMLKVTVLIALLRAAETAPSIMSGSITVPVSDAVPDASQQAYYPPTNPVLPGHTYTVTDLMNRLITQSDDAADAVLVSYLGDAEMSTVFNDLHIPLPGTSTGVSPQEYSHLFRVLYNGTYLTDADSESALDLLSQTTFTPGLVAGVPSGTIVAHKFGEGLSPPISDNLTWPATPAAGDVENVPGLSDCGIIYYPNHPYFLCVMTQGTDFPTLAGVIQNVSSIAWTQMNTLYSGS